MAVFSSASAAPFILDGRMLGGIVIGSNDEYVSLPGGYSSSYSASVTFGSRLIDNTNVIQALNSIYDYATAANDLAVGVSGAVQLSDGSNEFTANSIFFDSPLSDGLLINVPAGNRAVSSSGYVEAAGITATSGTFSAGIAAAGGNFTVNGDNGAVGAASLTAVGTVQGATLTDGTLSINGGSIAGGVNGQFAGTVQGGTISDGTLSINAGSIASGVNATFSGQVQGATLTDGTLSINGGTLSAGVAATFSGQCQAGSFTDGTLTITGGSVSGGVAGTFSGALRGGSLTDGTATITGGAISGVTTLSASGQVSAGNFRLAGTNASAQAREFQLDVDGGVLVVTQL
tara:strand:- start:562 stop:1596 length:1035 start_codon:yes stop_codon:yes gene_type:complete